ncbi:phosphatidate cytidylyltransferase [Rhizomicrobium electricum]|uniref:Phosphatidate cytidylyltransferase n=1 Tax=Rhizomicrobium electricum TaxID=480070 RepID=A0ABN1EQS3_9PROT|nr:phosphatidate cytidylyltransferase [Rhizomicrobium electricum]
MRKNGDSIAMAPGLKAVKFSRDWITRPFFAIVLGAAMVFAIFKGKPYLEIVAAVAALLAGREWHRLVGKGRFAAEYVTAAAMVSLSLGAFILWPRDQLLPLMILGTGAVAVYTVGLLRRNRPLWHAGGVLYLGLPSLAIIALHDYTPHGEWVLIGLFLIVWATDTGALVCGNLIGGPKLAPVLSPNKTWAGFVGGMISAAIAEAVFLVVLKTIVLNGRADWDLAAVGAAFGGSMAVIAHLGDLFESWAKRRFHVKDSGSMIPGHGGVLDRIDSTLATLVALAALVLLLKFDPLFGVFS